MRTTFRRRLALLLLALTAGAAGWLLLHAPPGDRKGRDFDPARLADLELRMWKAYYGKEKLRLFGLLVTMLRQQHHYSWARAIEEAYFLARAAAAFGDMKSDYERVLPDLEAAYTIARDWSGRGYDPKAVARAELAWWVARRDERTRSPENVGSLIGDLYALVYEVPKERVARAASIRAEAARLRDDGGAGADWARIGEMLRASFVELRAGIAAGSP